MNGLLIGDAVTGGLLYGLPLEPSFGLAGLSGNNRDASASDNKNTSKEAASSLCAAVFTHLLKVQESLGVGGGGGGPKSGGNSSPVVVEDLHTEKHYPDTLRALYSNYLQFHKKKKKGVTIVTPTHATPKTFPSHQVEFDGDGEAMNGSNNDGDGGLSARARTIMQCEHNRCLMPTYIYHGPAGDGGSGGGPTSCPLSLHIHADPYVPIFAVAVTTSSRGEPSSEQQSGSNSGSPSSSTASAFTRSDIASNLLKNDSTTSSSSHLVEPLEQRIARGALQVFIKEYGHNYMAAVVNGCVKASTVVDETASFAHPPSFATDLSKLLKDHLALPMTSISVKALKKLILPEIKNLYKRCIVGEFGCSVTRALASVSTMCTDKAFVRLNLGAPPGAPKPKAAAQDLPSDQITTPSSSAASGHLSQEQVNRLCPLSSVSIAFLSSPSEELRLKRPLPIPTSSTKNQDKEGEVLDSLLPKMNCMFHLYCERPPSSRHDTICCATPQNTNAERLSNKRWVYVECRRAIESLICLFGRNNAAAAGMDAVVPRFSQRTHSSFIYRCEPCVEAERKVLKKLNKDIKKRQAATTTNRNARAPIPLVSGGSTTKESFATPPTCFNVCVQCEPVDSKKLTHPVFLARVVIVVRLGGSLVVILRLNWLIETHVPNQQPTKLTPLQEKIRLRLGQLTNESGMFSQAEASQLAHAAGERAAHHFITFEAPTWLQGLKMLISNNIPFEM